jgi:hypothetical protein
MWLGTVAAKSREKIGDRTKRHALQKIRFSLSIPSAPATIPATFSSRTYRLDPCYTAVDAVSLMRDRTTGTTQNSFLQLNFNFISECHGRHVPPLQRRLPIT